MEAMIMSLVGSFLGTLVAGSLLSRYTGKRMAKGYQEKMYEYLKKEEEALNEKIKRSHF